MTHYEIFTAFRRRGHGSKKAATLTAYALLISHAGRKELGLSRHKMRQVKKAIAQAGIDPAAIASSALDNSPRSRSWQHEGVLHSGAACG